MQWAKSGNLASNNDEMWPLSLENPRKALEFGVAGEARKSQQVHEMGGLWG